MLLQSILLLHCPVELNRRIKQPLKERGRKLEKKSSKERTSPNFLRALTFQQNEN